MFEEKKYDFWLVGSSYSNFVVELTQNFDSRIRAQIEMSLQQEFWSKNVSNSIFGRKYTHIRVLIEMSLELDLVEILAQLDFSSKVFIWSKSFSCFRNYRNASSTRFLIETFLKSDFFFVENKL